MKSRFWFILPGLVMVLVALQWCGTSTGGVLANQIYWGVYMDGVPWDMQKLKQFESRVDKKVSIIHWGQPWWDCYAECGYQDFTHQLKEYDAVRIHGAIPMVDWASWDTSVTPLANQPKFSLKSIIDGKHDAYIREWANQARAWGHPFFLRLNWEMNGSWFPWSEVKNGNQPGEYVQAWRHIHDIFRAVGADNVTWVWCVSVEYRGSLELKQLYPGADYVDWVAIDGFNWSSQRQMHWRSGYEIFEPTYRALTELAPGKPIMISEVASTENHESADPELSKAGWIRHMFGETLPESFPAIKAVSWFNWNDNNPAYEWELDSSPQAMNAFAEVIASNYYAENHFKSLNGKVQPLGMQITLYE